MNKLKTNITLIILIALTAFIYSCNKSDKTNTQTDKKTDQTQDNKNQDNKPKIDTAKLVKDGKYVCSMHPAMQSNEPINCPICKMKMVLKSDLNNQLSEEHEKMESNYAGKKDAVHFEVNISALKSTDCSSVIETALKSDSGIMGYHIDALNRVVHMYFDKSKTSKDNIEKLISDAGFDANNKKAKPDAVSKLPQECK